MEEGNLTEARWVAVAALLLIGSTLAGPLVAGQLPPSITTIEPAKGDEAGGTVVEITGSHLTDDTTVKFGGAASPQVELVGAGDLTNTETTIAAVVPPGTIPDGQTSESVDVEVDNGQGDATATGGYEYVADGVRIDSIVPVHAPAADPREVTIAGDGFLGTPSDVAVRFGDLPGEVLSVSGTEIVVRTPTVADLTSDLNNDPVDVTVQNGGPASVRVRQLDAFTFIPTSQPAITGVSPTEGSSLGGTAVTITGEDFSPDAEVEFEGEVVTPDAVPDPQTIEVTTPPHDPVTVDVLVHNPDATATAPDAFTYNQGTGPTITGIPAGDDDGPVTGGTQVTIQGSGFSVNPLPTVEFDGEEAEVVSASSATIEAKTPPHPKGRVDVEVINPDGQSATLSDGFTYGMHVASVSPTQGPTLGETLVTIQGNGLDGVDEVLFGGRPGTGVTATDTQVTVETPPYPEPVRGTHDKARIVLVDEGPTPHPDVHDTGEDFTYTATSGPAIGSVSPDHGPSLDLDSLIGGPTPHEVVVSGQNFHNDSQVLFGNVPADSVQGQNIGDGDTTNDQLEVQPPPSLPRTVDVTVRNPDGQTATKSGAYRYTLSGEVPQITVVSPATGPTDGGTTVTVSGEEFTDNAQVLFGNRRGTNPSYQNVDDNDPTNDAIAVDAPAARETGSVDVTVVNNDGEQATSPGAYTYQETGLAITGFDPKVGSETRPTLVEITGTGFTADTDVTFAGQGAHAVLDVSDTEIRALAPMQSAGTAGPIQVTNTAGDTATSTDDFTYTQHGLEPKITSVDPADGPTNGGHVVNVTGEGFAPDAEVRFGGDAAQAVQYLGPTHLVAVTPPQPAAQIGPVDVVVENQGDLQATKTDGYTYQATAQPTITGITREVGPAGGGTPVVIEGSGFAERAKTGTGTDPVQGVDVTFTAGTTSKTASTILSATEDRIVAVTPQCTGCGAVDVTVTNPDGRSATRTDGFTYTATGTQPRIDKIQPDAGPTHGGTVVDITGLDFAPHVEVRFDGHPAQHVRYAGPTRLIAVTPVHDGTPAPGTAVDVTVTNPAVGPVPEESSTAQDAFTYDPTPAPSIGSVTPDHGPEAGGSVVTIAGSGFATQAEGLGNEPIDGIEVTFDGNPAHAILSVKRDEIRAVAPPCSGCDDVDVVVTNPDGQSDTKTDAFSYTQDGLEPTITAVVPVEGGSNGGETVTIVGDEFGPDADVTFGGTPAQRVAYLGPAILEVVTPPVALGDTEAERLVDVQVENANGHAATANDAYKYRKADAPTITSITPSSGPESGGIPVTIAGDHFAPRAKASPPVGPTVDPVAGVEVTFGGTEAPQILSATKDRIVAVVPPGSIPSGTETSVDVTVTNPDDQDATLADGFTYTTSGAGLDPTIARIDPTAEASTNGGVQRTIVGDDFHPFAEVTFGGQQADVLYLGPSTLNVTVPPSATAGDVTVEVADPEIGGPSDTTTFTYTDAPDPAISDLSPDSGAQTGGTRVTINGSSFWPGADVTFDGTDAHAVHVVNRTTIEAIAPEHPVAGTVDVTVTNPDGKAATLEDAYRYTPGDQPVGYHAQFHFDPALGDVQGQEAFRLGPENRVHVTVELHHADGSDQEFATGPEPRARLVLAEDRGLAGHVYENHTEVAGEESVADFTIPAADLVASSGASAWTLRVESPNDAIQRQLPNGQVVTRPANAHYNAEANATFSADPEAADAMDAAPTPILVPALPANSLAFVRTPATIDAGEPLDARVELRDPMGQRAAGSDRDVAIAHESGPGDLTGTTTDQADHGLAVFDQAQLTTVGHHTLKATSGGVQAGGETLVEPMTDVSPTITVEPGPPAAVRLLDAPAEVPSGDEATVTAEVLDAYGNRVTDQAVDLTLDVASAPDGASLSGETTATTDDGVATFDPVRLDALGDWTVEIGGPGLQSAAWDVHVTSARPFDIVIQQDDVTQTAGETEPVTYTVKKFDANGNELEVDSREEVIWSLEDGGGSFDDNELHPSDTAGTYLVRAELRGDPPGSDTAELHIEPGEPESLSVVCHPSPVEVNGTLDCDAKMADAHGNPVEDVGEVTWSAEASGSSLEIDANGTLVAPKDADAGPVAVQADNGTTTATTTVALEPGPPATLGIETSGDGTGSEVEGADLTVGGTVTYHAIHRDTFGNFAGTADAEWTLTGDDVGTLQTDGSQATLTLDAPGETTLSAKDAGLRTDDTGTLVVTDATGPSEVAGLSSSSHSVGTWSDATAIDVAWEAASDNRGVDGYSLLLTRGDGAPDATVETSSLEATLEAPTDGSYTVRVRAVDVDENAGPVAELGPIGVDTTPPGAPTDLTAVAMDGGGIRVAWGDATDAGSGLESYVVERATGDGAFATVGSVTGTSYEDAASETQDGTTYRYRVHAVDALGHDGPARTANATADHGDGFRTADPETAEQVSKTLGLKTPARLLQVRDLDGDGRFDTVEGSDEVEVGRTAKINGSDAVLLGKTGERPRAIWLTGEDRVEPVDPTDGNVTDVRDEPDRSVATVTVDDKAGWIVVYADDARPDRELTEVRTGDGRTIPLDQVWRDDGGVEVLDDPAVTYELVYVEAERDPSAFPLAALALVGLVAVAGLSAGWFLVRRQRSGGPDDGPAGRGSGGEPGG